MKQWYITRKKDPFYIKAKKNDIISRAYYKLEEIDKKHNLFKNDKKILDVGHHHGSTFYEHKAFINAIQNNLLPEISLNDGLMAVAIGEAAELSVKENSVLMMSEFLLNSSKIGLYFQQ